MGEVAEPIMQAVAAGTYPHVLDMATRHYLQPGYDFGDELELELGLALILDAVAELS